MTEQYVTVTNAATKRRVQISADGKPFTTYRYDTGHERIAKPVCYPVRAPSGIPVTRGFPLDPRAGERIDHPHQFGLWLAYGNVNGYDVWNNKGNLHAEGMGHVRHRSVERAVDGSPGELAVLADWLDPDENRHLTEETTYRFGASEDARTIDRITTLTADRPVAFPDDKEGFFGLRVRRELEHPDDEPVTLTNADGEPMEESLVDKGVTGEYRSSEGVTGTAVWGTRAPWVRLAGVVEDEPVTIVCMDHPDNIGHPTYWMARGYGLFAANPLGQAIYTNDSNRLDFSLEDGESITFSYRLAVVSGHPSHDAIQQRYRSFVAAIE